MPLPSSRNPGSRALRRRSPGPGTLSYCFSVGYPTSASGSAPGHPQNRFPTRGLPTTYTETDTLGQHFVQNSWKFVLFTLHARHLKVRAAIRRNTMFPPGAQGMERSRSPVPRPRACPPPHPSRSRRAPTAPLKLSCLKPYTSGVSSALDARAWRNGRRSGLEGNLSARRETGDAELPKFGESCHMAIPSQARPEPSSREGVETRRAAPNPGSAGHGEGIVQTANPASAPGRRKP